MSELENLIRQHLNDWRSGWSMGSFGAIAEFHQDEGEDALLADSALLARATARGGIRLDHQKLSYAQPVAYETLSPKRHRWSHALALCLPEAKARRASRNTLTELGPDIDAVRAEDRGAILFDLGLSLPQCDFCIRTGDTALIGVLRRNLGRSIFEPDNPVMAAVLTAHPHRIAITNLGRVEVYQKIGGPETGGVSPPGPHTHLLPKLMRGGRTHSANTPIPPGLLPAGSLHPSNPVIGPLGEDRPFDMALHEDFQALLERYGSPEIKEAKQAIRRAVKTGLPPSPFPLPAGRFARAAARLALRQLRHEANFKGDRPLVIRIDEWLRAHDSAAELEENDNRGH